MPIACSFIIDVHKYVGMSDVKIKKKLNEVLLLKIKYRFGIASKI